MRKVVAITGGSRGIGGQTAIEFAKSGFDVAISYNKSGPEALQLLEELRSFGVLAIAVKADFADPDECTKFINTTIRELGDLYILVNNVGTSQQELFTEISYEQWREMFCVNLDSCFICSQVAVRHMLKKGDAQRGKIINVSSIWGLVGASCEVHYSAAKAAMIGLTKALAKELGPSGIQVNCVAPGIVDTDMNKHLDKETMDTLINSTPLMRLGSVLDIAKTILFLASENSNFITGQVISPNGGFVV